MSITPQMIKDQEFEVKFRGFDPIEVRDYLEVIANEFFEMQENYKEQLDELEALREEKENSETHSSSLETDIEFTRKITDELKDGCAKKDITIEEQQKEIEELQLRIADVEQEKVEQEEEVSAAAACIEEVEVALVEAKEEKEIVARKVALLQDKNDDLQKEEVNFKSTLATAQRFAEDLMEKSMVEAEEIIDAAHTEINTIRDNAQEELDRLPKEIEILKGKKRKVKNELKEILETYLETLDVFYPEGEDLQEGGEEADEEVEEDDLFQKVEIGEDGTITQEDLDKYDLDGEDPLLKGPEDEEALATLFGESSDTEDDDGSAEKNLNDLYGAMNLDEKPEDEEDAVKDSL